ncbi:MAG: hypothetical protein GC161_18655 [Planctomycetaceae bacterium]|nr:hypothetical protein [Planctomycetaceae bacterium]
MSTAREPRAAGRIIGSFTLLTSHGLLVDPPGDPVVARAVALALVLAFVTMGWRELGPVQPRRPLPWLAAAGYVGGLGLDDPLLAGLAASAALAALAGLWGGVAGRALALAFSGVAVFRLALLAGPWFVEPVRDLAIGWSAAVGAVLDRDVRIAPAFLGLRVLAPAFGLLVARYLVFERQPRILIVGLLGFASATALSVLAIEFAAPQMQTSSLAIVPWLTGVPAGLFLASLLAGRGPTAAVEQEPAFRPVLGGLAACLSCLALFGTGWSHGVDPIDRPHVGLYSRNAGPILDWERPRFGAYGAYSLGMFGRLPELLVADGYEVSFLEDAVTPESLRGLDALVTINVNQDWTEDELLAVWNHVERGAGLLVIGDHTNVQGSRGSQNDLLAPVGIEFRFDSAFPASPRSWAGSDLVSHVWPTGASRPLELGVAVGASLDLVGRSGRPLLVGRHALSDAGDPTAGDRGYLGDYRYASGERLGDGILAAWASLGSGRVVAFGDTSGFQNAAIDRTYDAFVGQLFAWVSGRTTHDLGPGATSLLAALVAAAGLAALWAFRSRPALQALAVFGHLGVLWAVAAAVESRFSRPVPDSRIAWIDTGHLPRTEFGSDAERSLDGFENTLVRAGYRPVLGSKLSASALDGVELFVTIAPARPYSKEECDALESFVRDGGLVIACASYPESEGVAPLAERFGLEVLPRPVGSIPLRREPGRARTRVEYVDAWEVGVVDPARSDDLWVYGEHDGVPLAILARRGAGALFLVGDGRFLGSTNLETPNEFSEPNLVFLRGLFQDAQRLREEAPR